MIFDLFANQLGKTNPIDSASQFWSVSHTIYRIISEDLTFYSFFWSILELHRGDRLSL